MPKLETALGVSIEFPGDICTLDALLLEVPVKLCSNAPPQHKPLGVLV